MLRSNKIPKSVDSVQHDNDHEDLNMYKRIASKRNRIVEINKLPKKIESPIKYLGHVSSSYHSPNLNQSIGLAMIKGGNNLLGQRFFVTVSGKAKNIPVEIVNPVFIDPENKRLTS